MAKRLNFSEFETAIDGRTMPIENLSSYVEFDPASPTPKLTFKKDALLDEADPNFDVDRAVFNLARENRANIRDHAEKFSFTAPMTVVAEGDSWFNMPPLFFVPTAIADWIEKNRRFRMNNIADWGHTLAKMRIDRQHIKVMEANTPDFFIFSGGGNDLQEGIASGSYLNEYREERPANEYLTDSGKQGIAEIGAGYAEILEDVTTLFPDVKVFCYGYDYPRPLVREGKYIGSVLREMGVPDGKMASIVSPIMDLLNATIDQATKNFESVQFLDLIGETQGYTWYDDMHPDSEGFLTLSLKFEEAMFRSRATENVLIG
jgi:uncharacterized protein (DUF2164 family)